MRRDRASTAQARELQAQAPGEREDVVVHIGTRPAKNPWVSIRAVEILRERGHDVRLVVVGSRSEEVEELARGRGFVTVLFGASEREKNEVLCEARALVLPSSGETFSYASLEAMACGTPPVVSHAVPEDVVTHGYNGLRVSSLDPADYADALERLLANEDLWLRLSENARSFAGRFDHVEVARRYAELLGHLAGTTKAIHESRA